MWWLVKQSIAAWSDDYASSMGAALAYYTLFSLAPLLLVVIALAGFVYGQEAARGAVLAQFAGLIGEEGSEVIQGLLKNASQPTQSLIASLIGIVTLIVGATSIFAELQSDLDRIWRAPAARKPAGVAGLLRTRLLSFGLIVSIGFLLLVSLIVSAVLAALSKWYSGWFPGWIITMEVVNQVVSLAFVTMLFAMMYRILPSVPCRLERRLAGSAGDGRSVHNWQVSDRPVSREGRRRLRLWRRQARLWCCWCGCSTPPQIFLLGAEFTWLYAHSHGSRADSSPAKAAPSSRRSDASER